MSVLIGKLDREGELVHFLCFFFFRKIILPTRFTSEKHFSTPQQIVICLRIGHAIDVYSDHILDESMAYDEAASSEEERSSSIRKILSRIVNLNADTDMIVSDGDEDSAIQW
jgi:hypothetical protein